MILFALLFVQAKTATPRITSCKTSISTGNAEIDTVGCTASKRCWSYYSPKRTAARALARRIED